MNLDSEEKARRTKRLLANHYNTKILPSLSDSEYEAELARRAERKEIKKQKEMIAQSLEVHLEARAREIADLAIGKFADGMAKIQEGLVKRIETLEYAIEQQKRVVEAAVELADEAEHPRAFETATQATKALSEMVNEYNDLVGKAYNTTDARYLMDKFISSAADKEIAEVESRNFTLSMNFNTIDNVPNAVTIDNEDDKDDKD